MLTIWPAWIIFRSFGFSSDPFDVELHTYPLDNVLNRMIAQVTRLENLAVEKLSIRRVHRLLRSVIPADRYMVRSEPLSWNERFEYLTDNWLCSVIRVYQVDEITYK